MDPKQDRATNTGTANEKFPISFSANVCWERLMESEDRDKKRVRKKSSFCEAKQENNIDLQFLDVGVYE